MKLVKVNRIFEILMTQEELSDYINKLNATVLIVPNDASETKAFLIEFSKKLNQILDDARDY